MIIQFCLANIVKSKIIIKLIEAKLYIFFDLYQKMICSTWLILPATYACLKD